MGIAGSLAGGQLQQAKGSDTDRAQQDTAAQSRETKNVEKAELAAGIGRTTEDAETSDRDADGRRLWEADEEQAEQETDDENPKSSGQAPQAKDPEGNRGMNLDLSG
jgi:hypothetical protein